MYDVNSFLVLWDPSMYFNLIFCMEGEKDFKVYPGFNAYCLESNLSLLFITKPENRRIKIPTILHNISARIF